MIYAEIEYAPLPVTAKYAALQSNTAPDNNAASLATCQSSNHLTPHRLRGGRWSLGPPRPRRAFRPPRSPDAVVGWCDHQRRPQWANTEAPLPRWGTGLQFRVRRVVRILDIGRGAAEWVSVCGVRTSEKHSSMKAVTGQTW